MESEKKEKSKRKKLTKPKKKLIIRSFVLGLFIGLLIPWVIAFATSGNPYTIFNVLGIRREGDSFVMAQKGVPYVVKVDCSNILLDEAQREKRLIIYSQSVSGAFKTEKEGLFGLPIYAQVKSMILHGVGTFSVDLAEIKESDILVDPDKMVIEIHIPEPVLSVEYLPEQTEFLNTSNGILRFGEMEVTPEMMTGLEAEAKEKLRETIEADETALDTARRFAALSVKEIFEPVLRKQIESIVAKEDNVLAIAPHYSISVKVGQELLSYETEEETEK